MQNNRYSTNTYRRNIYDDERHMPTLDCDILTKVITSSGLQIYIPDVSPEEVANDYDGEFTNAYSACVDSGSWQNIDMACYININRIEVVSCVDLDFFTTPSLISKINIIVDKKKQANI